MEILQTIAVPNLKLFRCLVTQNRKNLKHIFRNLNLIYPAGGWVISVSLIHKNCHI